MKTKNLVLALLILGSLTITNVMAKTVQITFNYKFSNIVAGYDHNSRLKIYIDGNLAGTSNAHKESVPNTYSVQVESGSHNLRAVVETEYEGVWEEHIIANTYSIDCVYETIANFSKKNTIYKIDFDIDLGAIVNGKFNGVKVKKKR